MSAEEEVLELASNHVEEDSVDEPAPMRRWLRYFLVALTIPWLAVFVVAVELDPYQPGPRQDLMGTHQQLGLPECNFLRLVGVPCPSCGMTTSFSLLLHADVWNSMRANFAGTALAGFGLLFIPWAFASAFCGRFVFIRRLELVVFRLAIVFLIMLFSRWAFVIAIELITRSSQ